MKIASSVTALFLTSMVPPIHAGTVFLPNADAAIVGNDSSGSLAGSLPSGDVQDLWDKSQFGSVSGNIWITQLAFRLKPNTGGISSTVTSASISMSTTALTTATMSTTFVTNRGGDYAQVASVAGPFWSSPGCTGSGPCPFDIIFNFSTPFVYNPANGNLLIEQQWTGYNASGTGQFDVQNYALSPPVAELVAIPTAPTGTLEYSDNVTRLTFSTVPEPASLATAVCGLTALVVLRRRRRSPSRLDFRPKP